MPDPAHHSWKPQDGTKGTNQQRSAWDRDEGTIKQGDNDAEMSEAWLKIPYRKIFSVYIAGDHHVGSRTDLPVRHHFKLQFHLLILIMVASGSSLVAAVIILRVVLHFTGRISQQVLLEAHTS